MPKVPDAWMPPAAMKRIHVHWTAGTHQASAYEKTRYHILIEGDGGLAKGDRSIAANAPGSGLTPASHTLNANTGAIGVSICCMAGAKESPFYVGSHPMTAQQWAAAIDVIAQLARRYGIPVSPKTVLTHAEVQTSLGIPQKQKWDITRLPFDPSVKGHKAVGDQLRTRVAVALDTMAGAVTQPPSGDELKLPKFKVVGVAPSTLAFRRAPGGEKVGALSEGTRVERLGVVDEWWRVRTPGGFTGWVHQSFLKPV